MGNSLLYKDRYASNLDAFLFMFFAAVGVSWQLITRVYLDPAWSLSAVIIGLVLLMFAYFYIIVRAPYIRQIKEKGGDNLYFLGFIFTSVTFGIALYKVGLDTDQDIGFVLSELGIGLTTTILGLVLRITSTMSRSGSEEIEDIVYSNLKEQAEQLEKRFIHTAQSAEKANTLTLQIVEEANETLRSISKQTETQLVEGNELAAEFFNNALSNTDDSIDSLLKRLDSIEIPVNIISAQISEAISPLEKSVISISEKLDRVTSKFSEQNLANSISFTNSIETLTTRLNNIDISEDMFSKKFDKPLHNLVESIDQISQQLNQMNDQLKNYGLESATNADAMSRSLNVIDERVDTVTSNLAKYEEGLLNIETIISHSVDGITNKISQFSFDETHLTESISKSIRLSSESYQNSIEQFSKKIDAMPIPLSKIESEMESIIQGIEGKLAAHIENELKAGISAFGDQIKELAKILGNSYKS